MRADRDEPHAHRDLGALERENLALRAENVALRELCLAGAAAKRRAALDRAALDEILGSRAWAFVTRARRFVSPLARSRPGVIGDGARWDRRSGGGRRPSRATRPRLKVSVIVPCYNHSPFLEERLRSIFDQTYPPHEIIFLDDGSSDESVAVARRLASASPVPFRVVLNESNGGSTFRQWLEGIDRAGGDLVWIAESDDSCRPELLERLVPAFRDPEVALAYCQSAMIGPDGRLYAPDYIADTEDLAPIRWRYRYCVAGHEEVELALSQRNTIPNASAVVFRRPAAIEERADLEALRLAGDWLFYAMRIRRGRIAYIPEPLNAHRHHERTVRSSLERAIELFEEQMLVKRRIFEAFPVTPSTISGSIAHSFAEYARRTPEAGARTPLTGHPRLRGHIDRIRELTRARQPARVDRRILVVLSGLSNASECRAAIRQASELAGHYRVYLCNALPGVLDPRAAPRVDARIVLLEGTLGIRPWSWDDEPAASDRRAGIIADLIAFHRIDAIHAVGAAAERLVTAAGQHTG